MRDEKDLTGFELVSNADWGDGAMRLYVRRSAELTERLKHLDDSRPDGRLSQKEKEHSIFNFVHRDVIQALDLQERRLNPKYAENKRLDRIDFEKAFNDAGLGPIFMEEIPNEYWGEWSPEAFSSPWYNVTTRIGHIRIGWRKRVIELDWARTTLVSTVPSPYSDGCSLPSGDELFPKSTRTKGATHVHAGSFEEATRYLKVLAEYNQPPSTEVQPFEGKSNGP